MDLESRANSWGEPQGTPPGAAPQLAESVLHPKTSTLPFPGPGRPLWRHEKGANTSTHSSTQFLTKPRASDSANQKIPTVLVLWGKICLELLEDKISKSVSMEPASLEPARREERPHELGATRAPSRSRLPFHLLASQSGTTPALPCPPHSPLLSPTAELFTL